MNILLQLLDFAIAVVTWVKWLIAICSIPIIIGGLWVIINHLVFGAELAIPLWKAVLGTLIATIIGGLCWPREGEL